MKQKEGIWKGNSGTASLENTSPGHFEESFNDGHRRFCGRMEPSFESHAFFRLEIIFCGGHMETLSVQQRKKDLSQR